MVFSNPAFKRMVSIGGGQAGGVEWESEDGLKQPFKHKQQCRAFTI